MRPRVLLTATLNWPATARLAAALAGVGAHVEALLSKDHVARKSRFVAKVHPYHPLAARRALARAVEASAPDLVLPGDDRAVRQLLALADRELVARSLGRPESYAALMRRSEFIDTARGLGLAAPKMVRLESENDIEAALAALGRPAALKTDGSWGGEGTIIVRDEDEARAAFQRVRAQGSLARNLVRAARRGDAHFLAAALDADPPTVNLQAFVAGRPATTAFACWKGRVLASIHMDVLQTARPQGPASVMRQIESEEMERAAIRIAEHFGLSGLHGLDFIRDAEGRSHLLEINPRVTQAATLALGPGHDLAAGLLGALSPASRWPRPQLTDNPAIALFPQEWQRDPNSPWLKTAYFDVPWDDPQMLKACLAPGQPPPPRRPAERDAQPALTLRSAMGR
jgi:hypothetical protein